MTETDPTEEDWRARAEAAERDLAQAVTTAEQRLLRAELKAEALRAGMIDLDGIKLVDTAPLALDANGELPGAAQVMIQLKRSKPWLFGAQSSSSATQAPAAHPPTRKQATEMTHAEWRQARAAMLKR